ncbi:ABC transporter ATP-binding protein [Methanoplanus sp. FWC-SCC4]|uniref:ABC transporter ATP-binding protein n=1 Tax=Methanochimaera problematica TaxID=2609417 RepID=A0AA97FDM3_9EURY|nr:ABC transporter ATP-binding protein [Methanoplanus sp. FWC-SCC4]WOF16607.1 ABC transporter ATP-binding protein [Methanoplanus sp. FWC-SCC4]
MEKVVSVTDLKKTFDKKPVISGITFDVFRGEIFGFLGPNGAGKTTSMRIILGLLKADSGSALVFENSLETSDKTRARVGVLFENNGLFDKLSAYENLKYYAELYGIPDVEERIVELLEFTDLKSRKDTLVGTFSTGMKRKLGIARAILHRPEVLFLDEPTSTLDPEAQKMVRDLILHLSEDESMTVFLSSHNLDEVQKICSRVAILHGGRIKALDSVENLRKNSGVTNLNITLSDSLQSEQARFVVSTMQDVSDFKKTGHGFSIALSGKSASGVISGLCSAGINIEEVVKGKRSLEDIYIEVMKEEAEL